MGFVFRRAGACDAAVVAGLSLLLYGGENTFEGLFEETLEILKSDGEVIFVACNGEKVVGFAHCCLRRDYVEGTKGGPVGYLEGIYVMPEFRLSGVARALVAMCEDWARERGCSEFASDCEIENVESFRFHLNIGFREANRIICFVKEL